MSLSIRLSSRADPERQTPSSAVRRRRLRAVPLALILVVGLGACGDDTSGNGNTGPLPMTPTLLEPVSGATLDTDTPLFTVRNALGFDFGEADYTFRVVVASTERHVAEVTVPAGRERTAIRFEGPLLRGATLAWSVTALSVAGAETASGSATFRLPPVNCESTSDPYAKNVEGFWVPAVCLAENIYNDPEEALGPPDFDFDPERFYGFVSLGNGGWVDVDMEGCAVDGDGKDVRVWQAVSNEPVTLYASSSPGGPWVLVQYRNRCGGRCGFDLADAGIEEARYFRVQDGELYPCPGDTQSEGADIDAVEILNAKP
jgi:hypothetical protein